MKFQPPPSLSSILDSSNSCYLEDIGAEFLYPANPQFFDRYFKSMSIPGFKASGYRHYCKVILNINDDIIQSIPTAAIRRLEMSKKGYRMEFELQSIVTEDSLKTYVPNPYSNRNRTVGDIEPISSFNPKNEPVSLDIYNIFNTTFDDKAMSKINDVINKLYSEYRKAAELNDLDENYREMSAPQLVKYLLKNKFRNNISVSVAEYGVPHKYENRPRQAGSRFSDVTYDIDVKVVSENRYNLFVEPKREGKMNETIAYQVNEYVDELIQGGQLTDIGITINSGFDLESLDNDIGFKKTDAWKDFIVLGFSVSGPKSLFVNTKSKQLSDVILD